MFKGDMEHSIGEHTKMHKIGGASCIYAMYEHHRLSEVSISNNDAARAVFIDWITWQIHWIDTASLNCMYFSMFSNGMFHILMNIAIIHWEISNHQIHRN